MTYIPDFTNRSWQQKRSDARLRVHILDGKGTFMPAFRDKLTNGETQQMVGHVRSFHAQEKKAGEEVPDQFENRFRQLEEQMRNLRRQINESPRPPSKSSGLRDSVADQLSR
jgi:hypothetical protein